ncbi:MAG: GNAT family N-acetyltransferase [Betaproteobacteria bacterium]|nr:MAG: GNAT family N-acetyltransferase [Betaproteobacteria bacterium]TMH26384.1 MAG: GNAT family N-acetyltransferase [Betaproteobacteria bacterium]
MSVQRIADARRALTRSGESAASLLRTPRIVLQASEPAMAREVLDFYARNRAHFAPWDPTMPADFLTLRFQRDRLLKAQRAFARGEAYRYWMRLHDAPARVIGQIHFSSIVRGAFHSAMLGYQLDQASEGRGLMTEALGAGIAEMFSERVQLHRIQAAHMCENLRSAAVLARLGFQREGLAKHYLFIDGQWRDHVINALLNPAFKGTPAY